MISLMIVIVAFLYIIRREQLYINELKSKLKVYDKNNKKKKQNGL